MMDESFSPFWFGADELSESLLLAPGVALTPPKAHADCFPRQRAPMILWTGVGVLLSSSLLLCVLDPAHEASELLPVEAVVHAWTFLAEAAAAALLWRQEVLENVARLLSQLSQPDPQAPC